jgi:hypothetical protein
MWPVSILCEQLEDSPSGYHQHHQRRALSQGKPGGRVSNFACGFAVLTRMSVNMTPPDEGKK